MRKIFIRTSLAHAPGYPLCFHLVRVRMMEKIWYQITNRKAAGQCGPF